MNIVYIAPRYHTNQVAVVRGWKNRGDQVSFIVREIGPVEDHSLLEPVLLPYSRLFCTLRRIYCAVRKNDPRAYDIGLKLGFPSRHRLKRLLQAINPDVVILREKSVYSMMAYRILKRMGVFCLLYNQSPLWDAPSEQKNDLAHRLVNSQLPAIRITPVRMKDYSREGKILTKNSCFVPFVVDLLCPPESKKWFADDLVHILEIGRFERRKNHLLMLEAFRQVYAVHPEARLTIAGEVSDRFHEEYEAEVRAFVKARGLDGAVRILTNVPTDKMPELYRTSDLYVLPSSGEPAAISPLEAMASCLPAVCSTGNGTADYIEDGVTGHVFKDNDCRDLTDKILDILSSRERTRSMGEAAWRHIRSHYTFEQYYDALRALPGWSEGTGG